jgi:protein-disulfide isomerase
MKPDPLGEMVLGKADAPVTIIEYASMTCSHCAHFATTTMPELKTRYIDTGKVRYMLREFPLDPLAAAGFMLARCAAKDDATKYYAMIHTLFADQANWAFVQKPLGPLLSIAKQAGLSEQNFNACLANQSMLDKIEAIRKAAADKLGVNSTPTFFINGEKHSGDMSIDEMAKLIEPYLKAG